MTLFAVNASLLVGVVLVVGVLMLIVPRLARPGIFFAVTVDPALPASDEGRRILRVYRAGAIAASLVALGALAVGLRDRSVLLVTGSVVLQLVGIAAAFVVAHHRTLPHRAEASTVREADLVPGPARLPGGPALQAGPFVLLAAAAAWVGSQWQRLPARFPVHWDLAGHPDGFATRSPAGVFGPLVVGAVLCAALLGLSLLILTGLRRVSRTGVAGAAEGRFRTRVLAVLLGAGYLIAATFAVVTLTPLFGTPVAPVVIISAATLAFVVVSVAVLVRVGQGGARFAAAHGTAAPVGDRMADAHWHWAFYANRDDPALLVEKRFGIGVTFNFGNLWSWVILGGLVAVPIVLAVVLRVAR